MKGFGRLAAQIKSTRIVTGEHEYTRYGFRQLLDNGPDDMAAGHSLVWGLTELRRIAALAAAYDIPVIPHGGGSREGVHFIMATTEQPWAEMFMPAPGGPKEVYQRYEEDNRSREAPKASTRVLQTSRDSAGIL